MLKQKNFQGEKLEAAYLLLVEDNTTAEKIEKIKTLLKGLDPAVDRVLEKLLKALTPLDKLERGEVLSLSAEALPEKSEKEKKRKKALMVFFSHWRSLKSEVERVRKIYSEDGEPGKNGKNQGIGSVTSMGKVLGLAKGPLGLVTLGAVVVVGALGYLRASSVNVIIKNEGCSQINPNVRVPFKIPGVVLPQSPISSGQSGEAILPPLRFDVDGTRGRMISLTVLNYNLDFDIGGVKAILLNGKQLLGTNTQVDLGSSKSHTLEIKCN